VRRASCGPKRSRVSVLSVLPSVDIDVAASPTAGRELAALLAVCNQTLPAGRCALKKPDGEPAAAEASVTWDESGNALISVHLQGNEQDLVRNLVFDRADPKLQRWRSVGLTIATMVDELRIREEARRASPPPDEPERPAPLTTSPATPPPLPTREVTKPMPVVPPRSVPASPDHRPKSVTSLEAGVKGGVGTRGGVWRGGPYARAARNMGALPFLGFVSLEYQLATVEQPTLAWLHLELGGGGYWELANVRLEASLGLQWVRVSASARSPRSSAIDGAAAWLPGAEVALRGLWPARSAVAGVFGVHAASLARAVRVTNAGEQVAETRAYSVGLQAGVQLAL
jgi:hypothetical protein